MAVRVRKLAKELHRDVTEILGILHAVGLARYKTVDDMLPDAAVETVKKAIRDGVKPAAVEVAVPVKRPGLVTEIEAANDFMAAIVPGVLRHGAQPIKARPAPVPEPIRRAPAPAIRALPTLAEAPAGERAALSAERQALTAEREANEAERRALHAEREQLEAVTVEIQAERERLAQEWSALADSRVAVARDREAIARDRVTMVRPVAAPASTSVSLQDILAGRGFKGLDEYERAIGALAQARMLGDLLGRLKVDDVELVERFLRERVVLVSGEAPTGLGAAAVTVAPDRAELPDAGNLGKLLSRLGELFLLHGLRRVLVVGGRPAWHKLLRGGVDPRVELRFSPANHRARPEAEADVSRTDVVILWNVTIGADAATVYGSSRATVVTVNSDGLPALISAVEAALQ